MIAFDQSFYEEIVDAIEHRGLRGYTYFEQVQGRGSKNGEPHFGSHAWPSMNSAIITMVPDDKVAPLMQDLKELDEYRPQLGLRAFSWNIESTI